MKHIRNRSKVKENKPCLKALGNSVDHQNFANFFIQNAETLDVVRAYLFDEMFTMYDFTKEEGLMYRTGILDFMSFFEDCMKESVELSNSIDNQAEQAQ